MNWHKYYLNLLDPIGSKSKDPNTKLGCIIVGPDNEIRSTGFNSFPRRVWDTPDVVPERFERPEKYQWIEHAERNAIYNAARCGTALKGCRLYIGILPCMECARGIVQAGITEVIFDYEKQKAYPGGSTWTESWKRVLTLLQEAHVHIWGWRNPVVSERSTTEYQVDPRHMLYTPEELQAPII